MQDISPIFCGHMKLNLTVILAALLCSCTQTTSVVLSNHNLGNVMYASGKVSKTANSKPTPKVLAPGASVEVPLCTVTTRGLDLPFVALCSTDISAEPLTIWQPLPVKPVKNGKSSQAELSFNQEMLTKRWAEQDYLGRVFTQHLGELHLTQPLEQSYWQASNGQRSRVKLTLR
jgi:hypothetical protein